MQFRTTTLMFVIATIGVPLAVSARAGPGVQAGALLFASLAWGGTFLVAWASDRHPRQALPWAVVALTSGFFMIYSGALGMCVCMGRGLAATFGG